MSIPRQFIRVWIGRTTIPPIFEKWWEKFRILHPNFNFITINNSTEFDYIPKEFTDIYLHADSYAMRSDILRIFALKKHGGVYVDTDVLPLKTFDHLLNEDTPFIGMRSKVSFESAVIGSPQNHPALDILINALPDWYFSHIKNTASVRTGPAFISNFWFGRNDIRHLPRKTFYPYNGFMAPKREEKIKIFQDASAFPEEMIAAHFSNFKWGGNPNAKNKA